VVGPSPRSGEAETPPERGGGAGAPAIPPEVEVEAGPWGRARRRPPSEVEVEAEPWGRARWRSPSEAEVKVEPWGQVRRRSPSEAEAGAELWGRARRRLLLRPRPKVGRGGASCGA
jgi:hypothetical protein